MDKKIPKTPKEVTKLSEWQRRETRSIKRKKQIEQEERKRRHKKSSERQELLNQKLLLN